MEKELLDVTKKSGIVLFGSMIGNIVSLALNLIIARFVGAESYGQYTYIFACLSLFATIGSLGIGRGLVYFIPKFSEEGHINEIRSMISFGFGFVLCLSGFISSLVFWQSDYIAAQWLNKPELAVLLRIMAPLSVFLALISIFIGVYTGSGKIKIMVIIQNIYMPIIKLIALFFLILIGFKLRGLVMAVYLSTLCGLVLMSRSFLKQKLWGGVTWRYLAEYKMLLLFSLPIVLAIILVNINGRINTFMIGYYLSAREVGIYNIAYKVACLSSIILSIISSMFAPVISSLYHKGEIVKLGEIYKVTTKWMLTGNLIVLSLIVIFSREIMNIFGSEFLPGALVLVVLTLGQVINAGTGAAGSINTMTGHSSYELYTNALVLVLSVLMNYWLIPLYGLIGAALTSAITIGFVNIIRVILVYRDHRIHPYSWDYIKPISACALSCLPVWWLKSLLPVNWLIKTAVLSCVYLAFVIVLQLAFGLSAEDRLVIDKIINKLFRRTAETP